MTWFNYPNRNKETRIEQVYYMIICDVIGKDKKNYRGKRGQVLKESKDFKYLSIDDLKINLAIPREHFDTVTHKTVFVSYR